MLLEWGNSPCPNDDAVLLPPLPEMSHVEDSHVHRWKLESLFEPYQVQRNRALT